MPKLFMEVTFFAKRPDLRSPHWSLLLDYLIKERYGTFLDCLILQEEPVKLSKGRFLRLFIRGFNESIANLTLEISYDL